MRKVCENVCVRVREDVCVCVWGGGGGSILSLVRGIVT